MPMPKRRMFEGLICPRCESKRINAIGFRNGRRRFKCGACGKAVLAHYPIDWKREDIPLPKLFKKGEVQPFRFEDDSWDARALISLDPTERSSQLNFSPIQLDWFKTLVKRYIYQEITNGAALQTVQKRLTILRQIASHLENQTHIGSIDEITRDLILEFITISSQGKSNKTIENKLVGLHHFFDTGNLHGWFSVDKHLIRSEDYPKSKRGTPKDIPVVVLKQIESNLHKLPDPIARMWLIGYFCGMRVSEIQLLRRNCLQQDSRGRWFIEFWRKKTKDWHILPVARESAKIIQEQQDYIQQQFEEDFEYLFHDYLGLEGNKIDFSYLEPVARVAHQQLLTRCINHIIKAEDIRDENGVLWHFTNHQLRDTRLTNLFETGHEFAVVSQWAGHRQPRTTQKYVHVKDHTLRKATASIQQTLLNIKGEPLSLSDLPKTLQEKPNAHTLGYDDQINTPIYGYCGLPLDRNCPHWKACYTCPSFVARRELLPDYIKVRDLLRDKQARAEEKGETALIDQFKQQADSLDTVIASFERVA